MSRSSGRRAFGDWQTPLDLARAALALVARTSPKPAVVLEPTCGEGAFLRAAAEQYVDAALVGYEINRAYAETARAALPKGRGRIEVADFFAIDWERTLDELPDPILVAGNPPWVTNAILGSLGSDNLPEKRNFKKLTGYEALTGKSNFDISEWMLLHLLEALQRRTASFAVLCKTAVARRVVEYCATKHWNVGPGGLWRVDTMRHFRASVDAVLFVCRTGASVSSEARWPVYASFEAASPSSRMGVIDGVVVADAERLHATAHLAGASTPQWRSGIKHDCSRVMELTRDDGGRWTNGLGESVEIEDTHVYPLLKSSDVARGAARRQRAVIVPQRALGEDTATLEPKTRAYLCAHRRLLAARKSSIYRGQPEFAIFGVGPYSFAPWKVAVSGLYKRCTFTLVGPAAGRPVMVDDTCYFLPFEAEQDARDAWEALRSPIAQDFFSARIFWDAKRPVSKAVLQKLDLSALKAELRT